MTKHSLLLALLPLHCMLSLLPSSHSHPTPRQPQYHTGTAIVMVAKHTPNRSDTRAQSGRTETAVPNQRMNTAPSRHTNTPHPPEEYPTKTKASQERRKIRPRRDDDGRHSSSPNGSPPHRGRQCYDRGRRRPRFRRVSRFPSGFEDH